MSRTTAPGFEEPAEEQRGLGSALRREFEMLARSRSLIAACVAISLLLAVAYNSVSRPLYEATAVFSMDEAGVSSLQTRGSVDSGRRAAALQQEVGVLESEELALLVVQAQDPEVAQELAAGPLRDQWTRIVDEARLFIGLPTPHGTGVRDLVDTFRSRLAVSLEPSSSWITVRFSGYDPEATAPALSRLMAVYFKETEKRTESAAGASRQQLEERVTARQKSVVQTLGDLETFEKKEGLQGLRSRRQILEKELLQLSDSLVAARRNRISRRALLDEIQRISPSDMLSIPSVRDDREVTEISSRITDLETRMARALANFGDLHPEIVSLRSELEALRKRLASRLAGIKDSIARDNRLAQQEEDVVNAAIADAQANLSRLDKNAVEYSFIQKEAEARQRAVGELIDRSARESDSMIFFAPKVIQEPTASPIPVSPQRARNLQLALAFGLLLGVALAWLRSTLDETVRTPEDIRNALGPPLVGMVPDVGSENVHLFEEQTEIGASNRMIEAYRLLRTNLLSRGVGEHQKVLLVTSSRAGEGKTTTSCGLATTFARAGLRVLLIDCDLRRASLSRLLSAVTGRGLTDALGGIPLSECVREIPVGNLRFLSAGTPSPNPAELLHGFELGGLLDQLRPQYDWIICDAPPVLAVADAAILCRLADWVLMVVGANLTPIGSIRAAMEQLLTVGAPVRGFVLNRVDLSRDSLYYKYYYSSEYDDYSRGAKKRA